MLWLRHRDRLDPEKLAETDGAQFPFWSPDSRSIGFFAAGRLRRLDLDGGAVRTLAEAPNGRGGAWSPRGVILFAPEGLSGLYQVPAAGGEPVPVTTLEADSLLEGERSHRFPHFLPDGDHFTYVSQTPSIGGGTSFLSSLSDPSRRSVISRELGEVYPVPGQLLVVREGTLLARPFDLGARRLTGEGVALASKIAVNLPVTGRSTYSVSQNGVLAHRRFEVLPSRLVWYDRYGRPQEELLAAGRYSHPAVSPGLLRVAFLREGDLWIRDLRRGSESRLVQDQDRVSSPHWISDDELLYVREQGVYTQRVDRTAEPELVLASDRRQPDGTPMLVLSAYARPGCPVVLLNWDSRTNLDIWVLEEDGEPAPLSRAQGNQYRPAASPDGRWLAYESAESGRGEIVLQGLVDRDMRRVVSSGGGTWPRWSADGRELYFLDGEDQLMVVEVEAGEELRAGVPEALFVAPIGVPDMELSTMATPQLLRVDDEGFLFMEGVGGSDLGWISVDWNWNRQQAR
jgi:dipeptidyl aminopeptidase/acylaminoacyl peptidase